MVQTFWRLPWSAGRTADQKSNIKYVISSYTCEPIGMKLREYIQFDPGYCMVYFSTSGRNLETGSWLFAMKTTMFWHYFFLESMKTHSETILKLSDISVNGNTDKNLFVQENTVIWGHLRSKKVDQGHFGLKMMKKGWKVLKRDEIFSKYFESPLKFWWRHHLFEVHFEVLLTVYVLHSSTINIKYKEVRYSSYNLLIFLFNKSISKINYLLWLCNEE